MRFDDAGDALASHRTWIFNNEAYLESPDGKRVNFASFLTTLQTNSEVGVAFSFDLERPIDEYVFVYKTPGTIVNGTYEYEFKEIPLP